jgi:hypothetical protein
VLFKVAFASAVDPAALAEQWLGMNALLRLSSILPTQAEAYAACDQMEVSRARATDLFCGFEDGTAEQRQRFNLRLRWCPECAKVWFHSPLFQEWRRIQCPWHGVPLVTQCARCHTEIDLMSNLSWACACKEPMASQSRHWPKLFRAPIGEVALAGETGYLHTRPHVRSDGALELRLLQAAERSEGRTFPGPSMSERNMHRTMAFEEASMLLDFALGRHAECLRDEPSQQHQYQTAKVYTYNCPVAAAALFVAATTGCRTKAYLNLRLRGRTGDPFINGIVQEVLRGAPPWLARMLVRDLVTSMFQGALKHFLNSFKHDNRRIGLWREPGFSPCSWTLKGLEVAVLNPAATLTSVLELVNEADQACPWVHIIPPSKRL